MCAIVGVCEPPGTRPVDQQWLMRATDSLRHRGPDGQGFLVDENVGLGHRRLSIIDLAGGDQPIYNEDGSVGIVFNGEIFNYRELRPVLESLGHRFQTASDTEVIVHAYEQYGARCVEHFVGMFAFAIWDRRTRTLFAARDRLGIKPLFYAFDRGRLIFASELKGLLIDGLLPRRLDPAALHDYLTYGWVPTDRCILHGVHKLPPGHWMRWRDGSLELRQYWDVRFAPETAPDEDEWAERIEAALRESVRLRLRADVPLGVFLSGGVDSSAITALASQELGAPVKTFSVGFEEADYDEVRYARTVAERYRTEHHEIVVRDRDLGILGEIAYHLDEPFADPSALPTFYICREARRLVTVCLSGDGADEVFAGYTRYRVAQRYARVDRVPAGVRQAVGTAMLAVTPAQLWGRGVIQRLTASGAERYLEQMGVFTVAERRALLSPLGIPVADRPRLFDPYFARPDQPDLVSTLQHIDQKNYLPDDILVKVDRMSMQVSLEVRVPFLDHRVVEAVNSVPAAFKFRRGSGKLLLKRIMASHLPPQTLQRRKMGFGIPIKHWFRESMQDHTRELLLSPESRAPRYLDRGAIERTIRQHAAGMRDFSRKIWALMMFEHWCRAYRI